METMKLLGFDQCSFFCTVPVNRMHKSNQHSAKAMVQWLSAGVFGRFSFYGAPEIRFELKADELKSFDATPSSWTAFAIWPGKDYRCNHSA
jgi:hypothetical protein